MILVPGPVFMLALRPFYGEVRVVPLCLRGACENHV